MADVWDNKGKHVKSYDEKSRVSLCYCNDKVDMLEVWEKVTVLDQSSAG